MMEDLAMQMLEIIMNTVHADSREIEIRIVDSEAENLISMTVSDDGKGMNKALLQRVTDPFVTTRETRRIGMGIPFMKGLTEQCGGRFSMRSRPGEGTMLTATVQRDHIDTPPMGDLGEMMMNSIQADENIDYKFNYRTDKGEFAFDTREAREMLDGVSLLEPSILLWLRDYIRQGVEQARTGGELTDRSQ